MSSRFLHRVRRRILLVAVLSLALLTAGCAENMADFRETLGFSDEPEPAPEPEPEPEPEPAAPIARASANATSVQVGEPILLSGHESIDPEDGNLTYAWDFGDGRTDVGIEVTHAYAGPGIYQVWLTVVNDAGKRDTDAVDITVRALPKPPVAAIEAAPGPESRVGDAINFSGLDSADPDGRIVSYGWDLGDGTTASGANVTHAYERPGLYEVQLTVTDNTGLTDTTVTNVTVDYEANASGTLSAVGGAQAAHKLPVTHDATRLNLSLTFDPAYGGNGLALVLFDADGDEVARRAGTASPGQESQVTLELNLNQSDLADGKAGDWTAQVTLEQGLEAAYTLDITEHVRIE